MSTVALRRSQAAATSTPPSEIDREFLDALPDDIRDEIIMQERQEGRRREREEHNRQANTANSGAGAGDMDAATILASLAPALRNQVLMEQDEEVLALLPQELAKQARAAMREYPTHGRMPGGFARRFSPPGTVDAREINTTRPGAPDPSRQYVIPPPPPMSPPAQQHMMLIPPPPPRNVGPQSHQHPGVMIPPPPGPPPVSNWQGSWGRSYDARGFPLPPPNPPTNAQHQTYNPARRATVQILDKPG
jgi:hypothetical protein